MSAPYACWEKIIGLADTSCECFTDDMPDGASESASGLQLADLEGLNLSVMQRAATCATGGDLGTLLSKAREEAIRRTKSEELGFLRMNARLNRPVVNSQIGDNKNSRTQVSSTNTYHGLSMMTAHHVGGFARVKRIGLYMDFTGSVDVELYGLDDTSPEDTFTCSATQGVLTWTDVDLELSLEVEGERNPRWWFLWQPTGGQKALNCRIHCGCGGTRSFTESPWFESGVKHNDQAWMRWAMAGGTKGDTLADREDWALSNETQGIILDVEFGCENSRALCDGSPDYENDDLQMSQAYAVRFAAGSWIVSTILSSTDVSRETLTGEGGEGGNLYALKGRYEKGFKEHAIDYVAATLVQPPNEGDPASGVHTYADCFACKEKSGFKRVTHLR